MCIEPNMSYGGSEGQESDKNGFSYMDGIPVKIIKKYKPPKKIALPSVLQHKPVSNAVKCNYDFVLEKTILEKMSIWSKLREDAQTKRHAKAEEFKKLDSFDMDRLSLLDPEQTKNTEVLQPIPAQLNSKMSSHDTILLKNFNISDFESDTSSPFDNMELKTINDLEELATVLKPIPTTFVNKTNSSQLPDENASQYYSTPIYNNCLENYRSYQYTHSTSSSQTKQSLTRIPNSNICDKETTFVPPVTMPNVLLELKADLDSIKYNKESTNDLPKSLNSPLNGSEKSSTFPNPYRSLSPSSKSMVDQINQMGFPSSRAARACKLFGKDESKVIEFLIQIHSIEESSGYPADRVEQALVVNNFNKDDAVAFLKNVDRLIDFGFREENICSALVKCNNDPDKALDSLVSY
ncbi:ubiquitin-associated protein 1 [Adelges cooleyi]|uniref:ubiquitin-associated protein 1 n=1 Tax=Adelges cooleyi TaxID=133065 RepID=UPI00217F9BF4|nr:ubiquitin-associated protein 1 [Adelges cooleyi]